jgi:hypothetical protein
MTLRNPFTPVVAACVVLAGCIHGRGSRVAPERAAAVTQARAALGSAFEARDLDAFLSHLAPDARLIVGADTLDFRAVAERVHADLRADATTRYWMAGAHLRRCDRWVLESGGEFGYSSPSDGRPGSRARYLYALAWTTDSAGRAVIGVAALVQRDYGPPAIVGCRPTAKELYEGRRYGVAIVPGVGAAVTLATHGIETGLRTLGMEPRSSGGVPGFERGLPLTVPALGTAWLRLTPRIMLEALATLTTTSFVASGLDTTASLATGLRLQQRWLGVLASARVGDLQLGLGPAVVREAWHVSVERMTLDPARAITFGPHLTDAGATRNRVALLAQARLVAPLSRWLVVEARGHLLLLPPSTTPPAYGVPGLRVNTSTLALTVGIGAGF